MSSKNVIGGISDEKKITFYDDEFGNNYLFVHLYIKE
jgi:hypothetical protein